MLTLALPESPPRRGEIVRPSRSEPGPMASAGHPALHFPPDRKWRLSYSASPACGIVKRIAHIFNSPLSPSLGPHQRTFVAVRGTALSAILTQPRFPPARNISELLKGSSDLWQLMVSLSGRRSVWIRGRKLPPSSAATSAP